MCLQDPSIPTAKLTAGPLWVAPKQPIPVQTEFRTRVVGEFSSFKILEVDYTLLDSRKWHEMTAAKCRKNSGSDFWWTSDWERHLQGLDLMCNLGGAMSSYWSSFVDTGVDSRHPFCQDPLWTLAARKASYLASVNGNLKIQWFKAHQLLFAPFLSIFAKLSRSSLKLQNSHIFIYFYVLSNHFSLFQFRICENWHEPLAVTIEPISMYIYIYNILVYSFWMGTSSVAVLLVDFSLSPIHPEHDGAGSGAFVSNRAVL